MKGLGHDVTIGPLHTTMSSPPHDEAWYLRRQLWFYCDVTRRVIRCDPPQRIDGSTDSQRRSSTDSLPSSVTSTKHESNPINVIQLQSVASYETKLDSIPMHEIQLEIIPTKEIKFESVLTNDATNESSHTNGQFSVNRSQQNDVVSVRNDSMIPRNDSMSPACLELQNGDADDLSNTPVFLNNHTKNNGKFCNGMQSNILQGDEDNNGTFAEIVFPAVEVSNAPSESVVSPTEDAKTLSVRETPDYCDEEENKRSSESNCQMQSKDWLKSPCEVSECHAVFNCEGVSNTKAPQSNISVPHVNVTEASSYIREQRAELYVANLHCDLPKQTTRLMVLNSDEINSSSDPNADSKDRNASAFSTKTILSKSAQTDRGAFSKLTADRRKKFAALLDTVSKQKAMAAAKQHQNISGTDSIDYIQSSEEKLNIYPVALHAPNTNASTQQNGNMNQEIVNPRSDVVAADLFLDDPHQESVSIFSVGIPESDMGFKNVEWKLKIADSKLEFDGKTIIDSHVALSKLKKEIVFQKVSETDRKGLNSTPTSEKTVPFSIDGIALGLNSDISLPSTAEVNLKAAEISLSSSELKSSKAQFLDELTIAAPAVPAQCTLVPKWSDDVKSSIADDRRRDPCVDQTKPFKEPCDWPEYSAQAPLKSSDSDKGLRYIVSAEGDLVLVPRKHHETAEMDVLGFSAINRFRCLDSNETNEGKDGAGIWPKDGIKRFAPVNFPDHATSQLMTSSFSAKASLSVLNLQPTTTFESQTTLSRNASQSACSIIQSLTLHQPIRSAVIPQGFVPECTTQLTLPANVSDPVESEKMSKSSGIPVANMPQRTSSKNPTKITTQSSVMHWLNSLPMTYCSTVHPIVSSSASALSESITATQRSEHPRTITNTQDVMTSCSNLMTTLPASSSFTILQWKTTPEMPSNTMTSRLSQPIGSKPTALMFSSVTSQPTTLMSTGLQATITVSKTSQFMTLQPKNTLPMTSYPLTSYTLSSYPMISNLMTSQSMTSHARTSTPKLSQSMTSQTSRTFNFSLSSSQSTSWPCSQQQHQSSFSIHQPIRGRRRRTRRSRDRGSQHRSRAAGGSSTESDFWRCEGDGRIVSFGGEGLDRKCGEYNEAKKFYVDRIKLYERGSRSEVVRKAGKVKLTKNGCEFEGAVMGMKKKELCERGLACDGLGSMGKNELDWQGSRCNEAERVVTRKDNQHEKNIGLGKDEKDCWYEEGIACKNIINTTKAQSSKSSPVRRRRGARRGLIGQMLKLYLHDTSSSDVEIEGL